MMSRAEHLSVLRITRSQEEHLSVAMIMAIPTLRMVVETVSGEERTMAAEMKIPGDLLNRKLMNAPELSSARNSKQ